MKDTETLAVAEAESLLSEDEVEFYHENGYLAVSQVLSQEEVEELRTTIDEFVEKSREITENDAVFDLEPSHSFQNPRLRRLKSPSQQHPVFEKIRRHDRILDIVSQLIGPDIYTNGDKMNMKLPDVGSPVEWHQDWAFYPHTNDDILAVGITLDESTRKNGCLMVIPGSHKGPILDHHQDGHFVGAVTEHDFDLGNAVPIELDPGDISIHHVRALHGSMPNTSGVARRLLLIQYGALDAWPLQSPPNWRTDPDAYNAGVLRGQPNFQPRLTDVPVRLPLPPSKRGGSIYETQLELRASTFGNARP